MRWTLLLWLLLVGCVGRDAEAPLRAPSQHPSPLPSLEAQLEAAIDSDDLVSGFERFELYPLLGPGLSYAARWDTCEDWWGGADVFDVVDGVVTNVRGLPIAENCVCQMRCIVLEQFEGSLIEAYGMSHMGNGSFYLFHMRPDGIDVLIDTWGVDFHADEDMVRGGLLTPRYEDLDGDGFRDLKLWGVRDFDRDDSTSESTWLQQELISRCFLYDPLTGTFQEDKSRRAGGRMG